MISRRANKNDIPQLVPLWQELMNIHSVMEKMFMPSENAAEKFAEFLGSILEKENFFITVIEIDSKIVGYGIASVIITPEVFVLRRRLYVQDVVVDPQYRRKGIASRIVEDIKAFAKEQRIEKMDLMVAVKNESANKFWKEMGFEPALNYMNLYLV